MFMFMSLNVRVSKSFNCDFVIFNQIFSRFWNLFCNESNTWLNESSPSHVTWIVLFRISCGEQEHGDISGLIEQCNEATCTIDTTVYTRDAIFFSSFFFTYSSTVYTLRLLFSVKLSTWYWKTTVGPAFHTQFTVCEIQKIYLFSRTNIKNITFSCNKNSFGAFWNPNCDIFTNLFLFFLRLNFRTLLPKMWAIAVSILYYCLHLSEFKKKKKSSKIGFTCWIDFTSKFFPKNPNKQMCFRTHKKMFFFLLFWITNNFLVALWISQLLVYITTCSKTD